MYVRHVYVFSLRCVGMHVMFKIILCVKGIASDVTIQIEVILLMDSVFKT